MKIILVIKFPLKHNRVMAFNVLILQYDQSTSYVCKNDTLNLVIDHLIATRKGYIVHDTLILSKHPTTSSLV